MNIRNIAVIAHVDHGKTTLVDAILKQTNVFRENEAKMFEDCIMDSGTLERERGITIMAKNCAVVYQDTKINVIDTPGHADFSGEVERTLNMADAALLIVDAQEGPMPQTRFVLKKALELKLKVIVVINKIDKQFARVDYTLNKLSDLFLELAVTDDQLDFPVMYGIGRKGVVWDQLPSDINNITGSVKPLLDKILEFVPAPKIGTGSTFKMQIASLDYDTHLGRIAIGRIYQGTIKPHDKVVLSHEPNKGSFEIAKLFGYQGIKKVELESAAAGDIVALTGLDHVGIGMTIANGGDTEALPDLSISEPTITMTVGPNTSPFSGKEGDFVTARQIEARLDRELENNVSLKIKKSDSGKFQVAGRGELHLSVLLETMRRESYEFEVGKPEVITKKENGVEVEPVEEVEVLVHNDYVGVINQELGKRFAVLTHMNVVNETETEFIYRMPTRAILGLRSILLTATKGTVVINSQLIGFEPLGKEIPKLRSGVIIADQSGKAVEYGLRNLKGRGTSFVEPGTDVYEGMIVGQNAKDEDIEMNVCKEKELTNHRKKGHQGITELAPDQQMSLEQALDFLEPDELLEVTPQSLRLRKKHLSKLDRARAMHPRSR